MTRTELVIDPHVHSVASPDGRARVERLLERAAAVGLDGIVVTDHDAVAASVRAAERASAHGLVGVPGVEVSSADGHVLAIGVDEVPTPDRPFAATVAEIRALGGAAVVPHPFQPTKHGASREALADCDGIETRNASALTGMRNRAARRFADRRGYPALGGSDAHVAGTVGRAATAVTVPSTVGDRAEIDPAVVVDAIRRGAVEPRGRTRSPGAFVATHAAGVRARIAGDAVESDRGDGGDGRRLERPPGKRTRDRPGAQNRS